MPSIRDDGGGADLQEAAAVASTNEAPARGLDRGRPRWLIYLGLAATIVVLDQLTKTWLVANLEPGSQIRVIDDYLRLVYSPNTGALFGLFRDNAALFATVSIGVIGAIAWYHGRSAPSMVLSVALGLLTGGAVGNLIDRLTRGHVVDFVDAGIGNLRWYTFNVADAAISTALVLLVALALVPSLAGDPRPTSPGQDA